MWGGPIDFMKIVRIILVFVGIAGAYMLGQKSGKIGTRPDECNEDTKVMYKSESFEDYGYGYGYDYAPESKDKAKDKKDAPKKSKKSMGDGWVCPKVEGAGIFGMPSIGKYWWAYLMTLIGLMTQFSFTCAGGLFGAPEGFQRCLNNIKNARG
jgi:hypothetical protein